jgi:hypothetical protein
VHVLAYLLLGLSLLAKAWGMTFAAVLLAVDLFVLKRPYTRALLAEKVPFLVLGLVAAMVAMFAQGSAGAVLDLEEHGALDRLLQAGYGLAFYVVKTIAPFGLSPLYLREELRAPSDVPLYWMALGASLLVTVLAVATRRRHPWFLAAWACYLIIASPVLGLLQSGAQAVADRYTYIASMPWGVLAAAGVWRLSRGSGSHRQAHAYVLVGATSLVVLGLAILTVEQSAHWRTTLALWDHAVRIDPTNYVARTNRANALLAVAPDAARTERGRALLMAAMNDYSESIALAPGYGYAYASRGLARMGLGQYREAANDFTAAIDLVGQDPDMILQRGLAHAALGERQVALADFEEVLRLNPTSAAARANRDILLAQGGTSR